jgi:hypothetical protein
MHAATTLTSASYGRKTALPFYQSQQTRSYLLARIGRLFFIRLFITGIRIVFS